MKISVSYNGSQLDVLLNGTTYFKGRIKKRFWRETWLLLDDSEKELAKYTLDSRYFVYDFKVSISIGNEPFAILNYNHKRPHFQFEYSGGKFLVVFHKGNDISFFRDGSQIAKMKKKTVSAWTGQEFTIITNDDTDLSFLMLVIYAVLITKYNETDEDSDFNIDLGTFGNELLPHDKTWQPRILGAL